MCKDGIWTAKNIIFTFFLIGMLTATWRGAGTISVIVAYAASFVSPDIFLLACFLLNCLVSVLTGTSFGTVATMGVICMTMANAMHISPVIVAGAIISGIFYGDRCSPVSTSALLVSELTGTDIFNNIKNMIKTAIVPTLLVSAIYLGIGTLLSYEESNIDLVVLFGKEFNLNYIALAPAVIILGLSFMRIPVKKAMSISIASALLLCLFLQDISFSKLWKFIIYGYEAKNLEVGIMINGGGIISILKPALIICISSCYSGIFEKTKLLGPIQDVICKLAKQVTSFGAVLCASIITSAISCNQTLSIMLTYQLCKDLDADKSKLAVNMENTVVLVAAMYPWSIAVAVPLAALDASPLSICFAFFLYVVPLWNLIKEFLQKRLILKELRNE